METSDWHFLHIDPGEEPDPTIWHPDTCPVSFDNRPPIILQRYGCAVAMEIENAGFDRLFREDSAELVPGLWRVRTWIEQHQGFEWTEYSGGWEVQPVAAGESRPLDKRVRSKP